MSTEPRAAMRPLCTPTEIEEALDEVHAPTESGGVELAYSGRIRALAFRLITEGNQQRSHVHLLRSAIQIALKEWHKFTDHLDDSIAVRDILENALADTTPTGRDPERLGLGASTPDIPESGSPSLGPSEGSTGKPGSGSAPKAPLSITPNPYGSPSDFCTMPEHVAAKKRCTWDKLDAAECYFTNHPGVVVTEPWEDEE